jgi:hypothetical protein
MSITPVMAPPSVSRFAGVKSEWTKSPAAGIAAQQASPIRRSTSSRPRVSALARSVACTQYPSPPSASVALIRPDQSGSPSPAP